MAADIYTAAASGLAEAVRRFQAATVYTVGENMRCGVGRQTERREVKKIKYCYFYLKSRSSIVKIEPKLNLHAQLFD